MNVCVVTRVVVVGMCTGLRTVDQQGQRPLLKHHLQTHTDTEINIDHKGHQDHDKRPLTSFPVFFWLGG
jgi:hypothetical protein